LFSNTSIKVRYIPDRDVWIIIGILIGIEAVLLLALTFGADISDEIILVDEHRQSMNYKSCTYDDKTVFIVMMVIIYTSKVALIIWGVVLSIQLRGVKYRVYNEVSVMAFSIYISPLSLFFLSLLQKAMNPIHPQVSAKKS